MPNVVALIGAGLIGVLFAGLYLLYSEEPAFSNVRTYENNFRHTYENEPRRHAGRLSSAGPSGGDQSKSHSSENINFSERYDTRVVALSKRKKRKEEEEDENCAICCDALERMDCHTLSCQHKFHLECLKNWVKSILNDEVNTEAVSATCPNCRYVIRNPYEILRKKSATFLSA